MQCGNRPNWVNFQKSFKLMLQIFGDTLTFAHFGTISRFGQIYPWYKKMFTIFCDPSSMKHVYPFFHPQTSLKLLLMFSSFCENWERDDIVFQYRRLNCFWSINVWERPPGGNFCKATLWYIEYWNRKPGICNAYEMTLLDTAYPDDKCDRNTIQRLQSMSGPFVL